VRLRRGGERWDEVCGLGHVVEAHDTHVTGHVPACVEQGARHTAG